MYRIPERRGGEFNLFDQFGVRGPEQVARDVSALLRRMGFGPHRALDLSTLGFARPDLSLPAYAGLAPKDGIAPIYNFFDRTGGGADFGVVVTRRRARDYRGGKLTYDLHDGTDFVCPPGTPLACAAPGVLVASRDRFLRGGLTACVDHGDGVVTQYTHLAKLVAEVGQPLRRGDVVGLSGASGIDMLSGFPWVPPHVHFMVWVRGRPVDPYRAQGEPERAGTWLHGDDPRPSDPIAGDRAPLDLREIASEPRAIERVVEKCVDASIRREIAAYAHDAGKLAVIEDSLHHDRAAWPRGVDVDALRPPSDPRRVTLTLPLPAPDYRGARAVDAPWTRPRS